MHAMDQHHPGHEPIAEALMAALHATFGHHPGQRADHAKGIVATGTFLPSAAASRLSRAAHLQGEPVPVTLRFSNFSGLPQIHDADKLAGPRGLGIRFHSGKEGDTDIVAHSFDGFPVGTPDAFLGFVQAIAAAASPSSPDSAQLKDFLARHESARRYLDAVQPVPRSFTSIAYFGVNAFVLAGPDGGLHTGRYRIEPWLAAQNVPAHEVPALEENYLGTGLAKQLAQGAVSMRLVFQLAGPGDDSTDGSVPWPHSGPDARVEHVLGELRIEALASDQVHASRELALDPGRLIDGVQLSDDPMVPLRSSVYRLAASRRR